MKWKLQEYALIAELISAFVVVLTLIILIVEIRENTEITKLSAYQAQIVHFSKWRDEMASDDSKLILFNKFNLGELPEPNSTDDLKLHFILDSLWGNLEQGYISYSLGIIEGEEWDRIQRSVCFEYPKLIVANNKDEIFLRLSSDFTEFVESTCKS